MSLAGWSVLIAFALLAGAYAIVAYRVGRTDPAEEAKHQRDTDALREIARRGSR